MVTALVKIGGSVLTDKRRVFSTRPLEAAGMATDIRLSRAVPVVVHGTGSSGKAFARHYARPGRWTNDPQVFQLTNERIRRLQDVVTAAFRDAGVPCCPLPAGALFRHDGDTLDLYDPAPLRHLVDCGVVPLVCGDVVADAPGRFRIVSSDAIAVVLARHLAPRDCVFATDVDGVLDHRGWLLDQVSAAAEMAGHDSDRHDITGGMAEKVGAALAIAGGGTRTTIVNGRVPGRLRQALARRPVTGTRVVATNGRRP